MVLPFTGFPSSWRTMLFFITGIALMYLAYLFYIEARRRLPKDETESKTFVDNIGSGE